MTEATDGPARAQDAVGNPRLETRLKVLSEELRCLVCQNQSLADSNADLAVDLRNQVREQMQQGRSDDQIKAWLVQRYGDFVLYKPPVQRNTGLLWFGPFVLLLIGALVWGLMSRRGRLANGRAGTGSTDASSPTPSSQPTTASAQLAAARKLLDDER